MTKIIEENPVSMLRVKEIFSKKKELSERENRLKDYINVFCKLDKKKEEELRKKFGL